MLASYCTISICSIVFIRLLTKRVVCFCYFLAKFYIRIRIQRTGANLILKVKTNVFRYCGDTIPPRYMSRGNQLYLRFKSDSSVSHSGFRASYETGKTSYCIIADF
jgi:hypothetical protein